MFICDKKEVPCRWRRCKNEHWQPFDQVFDTLSHPSTAVENRLRTQLYQRCHSCFPAGPRGLLMGTVPEKMDTIIFFYLCSSEDVQYSLHVNIHISLWGWGQIPYAPVLRGNISLPGQHVKQRASYVWILTRSKVTAASLLSHYHTVRLPLCLTLCSCTVYLVYVKIAHQVYVCVCRQI